jgi:hypothetical protein
MPAGATFYSVLLKLEVLEQVQHTVVEEHHDVARPDGSRLREDSGFHLVEGLLPCGDLFGVQLAPLEVGEEELSC